jgi:hypothetical protein
MSSLPFVNFDEFGSIYTLTVLDLGTKWFARKEVNDRIHKNPVLAYYYQNYGTIDVNYKEVRARNPTKESDKAWIEGLSKTVAEEGDEGVDMLKLVHMVSPDEVGQKLDDIVLTPEQEAEVGKIVKAIEYRDYLRKIGLREIGKLLFVGPPGTGKTSTARAMSARLGLPFLAIVTKSRETRPQKEQNNSAQQHANVRGAFAVTEAVPSGPVLLIDDVVDSRWTLTVVAARLRHSGSGPVYPVVLAEEQSD